MVRTPAVVIGEIAHSLDEVTMGWSMSEDWRIELGINDARRELEELRKIITEAES
ncbi:MAG: hypothetical protein NWE89_05355 [Candidatus Bathyarchaeota archaeon]|nr:hypothetical protein [Candidatus Bathyarchaeota archaeon]